MCTSPGLCWTCPLSLTCTPPEFTQPHAQVDKVSGKATHPPTSYVTHRRLSSWVGDAHNPLAAPRPILREIHKRWCPTSADYFRATTGALRYCDVSEDVNAHTFGCVHPLVRNLGMPDSDVQEELAALAIMASESRICYRGVQTRTLRRTVHRREFTMSMAL
jgi:hypothetical protein